MESGTNWTGDPNSGNQRWSKWRFTFVIVGAQPTVSYVRENAQRFFAQLFRSTSGAVRVTQIQRRWHVELRMEGIDVHDPAFRQQVQKQFVCDFLQKGFRGVRFIEMEAGILAGTREDGSPRDHLIIMPLLSIHDN